MIYRISWRREENIIDAWTNQRQKQCELELRTLYTPVNSALQDGKYLKPGGYEEYREDKKRFRKAYLGDGKGYLVSIR